MRPRGCTLVLDLRACIGVQSLRCAYVGPCYAPRVMIELCQYLLPQLQAFVFLILLEQIIIDKSDIQANMNEVQRKQNQGRPKAPLAQLLCRFILGVPIG